MMFSIRSFVLYAVGTSMCGGLLVLFCLPLCALLRRLRAPSKLLCLLWLAVGLRFLLPGGIPVSIRQPGKLCPMRGLPFRFFVSLLKRCERGFLRVPKRF